MSDRVVSVSYNNNYMHYLAAVGLLQKFSWQYFSNPKVAKEPVPPQLELIAQEILVPMLMVFRNLVEKVVPFTYS